MNNETYIFDNGNVYTMVDGKVTSSVKESEFEESNPKNKEKVHKTKMPDPPKDIEDDLEQQSEEESGTYSRVTTPNGLSGNVLGRVSGMWGDEVTVRFDNGRIVSVPVNQGLTFHAAEEVVEEDPTKALEARLAQSIDGSKESLENRVSELKSIRLEAASLIQKGAAYETEQELDRLRVEADYELGEVHAALEHLNDAESFTAPAPFRMQAVEQESVGSSDSTWLDSTVNDMISEAEATDFGKLMDEGPEAFTAGLDAPALAEAGITRSIASRFINSKTAAANPELRKKYEQVWLARVEECRKAELLNRKETTKKEAASQEEESNLPDDVLFT